MNQDAPTGVKRKGKIMSEVNTETTQAEQGATEGAVTEQAEKMVSQSQLNAIIDKKFAKIASQHKEELEKVRQEALTEGQKLAKMSADERAKHDFEEKVKELSAREQALTKGELKSQAKAVLIEKGMPIELAEYLPFTDAETTMQMLDTIEKGFRKAVEDGINDRLKGNPPKVGQRAAPVDEVEKLTNQYNEAVKAGKTIEAVALKNKLFKLEQEKK
jgi:hypothetical protein